MTNNQPIEKPMMYLLVGFEYDEVLKKVVNMEKSGIGNAAVVIVSREDVDDEFEKALEMTLTHDDGSSFCLKI